MLETDDIYLGPDWLHDLLRMYPNFVRILLDYITYQQEVQEAEAYLAEQYGDDEDYDYWDL